MPFNCKVIDLKTTLLVLMTFAWMPIADGALILNINTAVSQNFDIIGAGLNLASLDTSGWRIDNNSIPQFSNGVTIVSSVHADSSTFGIGGTYNFGGAGADRSIGSMSSQTFSSPRHLILQMQNGSSSVVDRLGFNFDWERFRVNTATANGTFFHSADGTNWTAFAAGNSGDFASGSSAYGTPNPGDEIEIRSRSGTITGLSLASGANYYFRWSFNTGGASGQAIGIDNFSVIAAVPEPTSLVLLGLTLGGLVFRRGRSLKR